MTSGEWVVVECMVVKGWCLMLIGFGMSWLGLAVGDVEMYYSLEMIWWAF